MTTHHVKARAPDTKRFWFLTPSGKMNPLRIHAAMMTEDRARELVAQLTADNPGWTFRVQRIDRAATKAAVAIALFVALGIGAHHHAPHTHDGGATYHAHH